jgi:hypothetical protein
MNPAGFRRHSSNRENREANVKLKSMLALAISGATLLGGVAMANDAEPMKVTEADTHVDVTVGGKPFTTYWIASPDDRIFVRPFFYPVNGPGEVCVTSDQYPLWLHDTEKPKKIDHPHHMSLWVGQGNVGGADHWSLGPDNKGTTAPKQHHVKFDTIWADRFVEELIWDDTKGQPMLNEVRTVQFTSYEDGARGIDITSVLTPAAGDVTFHDTKEAGMMAVRLNGQIASVSTITESTGKGGEGAAGEKAAWGKRADWCDESGKIDGKPFGVAIFDSPANPRHPAYWHVRAWGLLAANVFGLNEFDKSVPKSAADLTVEKGKSVTFHHRAVIHAGMAVDADLGGKYKDFVDWLKAPPVQSPANQ